MNEHNAVSTSLVESLFDFNNAENQELFDYLSEHLYIQSHLAMPRIRQLGNFQEMKNFYRSCHKLYCATNEFGKQQAMDEIRTHIA